MLERTSADSSYYTKRFGFESVGLYPKTCCIIVLYCKVREHTAVNAALVLLCHINSTTTVTEAPFYFLKQRKYFVLLAGLHLDIQHSVISILISNIIK